LPISIDSKPQTGNIIPSSQALWLIDAMNELLLMENSHMHSSLGGAIATTAVMQVFFRAARLFGRLARGFEFR
jgi:hypothetical protein